MSTSTPAKVKHPYELQRVIEPDGLTWFYTTRCGWRVDESTYGVALDKGPAMGENDRAVIKRAARCVNTERLCTSPLALTHKEVVTT